MAHVEKCHTGPRFTAEASAQVHKRTNQYQVARTLYRQRLLLECVPASQPAKFGFLEKSADVIQAFFIRVKLLRSGLLLAPRKLERACKEHVCAFSPEFYWASWGPLRTCQGFPRGVRTFRSVA